VLETSGLDSRVIAPDVDRREEVLTGLQVTVASTLGAFAWNCGMVLVDHGWVRLVGSGLGSVSGLHAAILNDAPNGARFEGIVVAYDVLGGRFAIHGRGLSDVEPEEIVYWGPDTLDWSPLGFGHSAFVDFVVSERLAGFYGDLRWHGWERDSLATEPDHGLGAYPPPWTVEGKGPGVSRRPVPIEELVASAEDFAVQMSSLGNPERFRIQ
jgi:hypothetical protein